MSEIRNYGQHVRNAYAGPVLPVKGKLMLNTSKGTYMLNGTYADVRDVPDLVGRSVWKVSIKDEMDNVIENARIYATQTEAQNAAEAWLMRMLATNPGSFLKWEITQHIARD